MRRTCAGLVAGLAVAAVVPPAGGQDKGSADRDAAKLILASTVKLIEPKVKDNKEAADALKKLSAADPKELDRMARDLKAVYDVPRLDPDGVKKIEARVASELADATPRVVQLLLVERDPKSIPKQLARMCWLRGCP